MFIRRAKAEDAAGAVETLRASIRTLCVDDHLSNPDALAAWLSNKTVESFQIWLNDSGRLLWVCLEKDQSCLGVAMASTDGEIMLNYVAPAARFKGVSAALLKTAESYLCESGCSVLHLWSTRTARRFYLSRGWREDGLPIEEDGMFSYPMNKPCPHQSSDVS